MLRIIFIFFIAQLLAFSAMGQNTEKERLDSLQSIFTHAKEDTSKVKLLVDITNYIDCSDTLQSLNAVRKAKELAEKLQWQRGKMLALMRMGSIYEVCVKNYPQSIRFYLQSIPVAVATGDSISVARVYNSMGLIYARTSTYDSAVAYYKKSLASSNDLRLQAGTHANLGLFYNSLGDYLNALACYEQASQLNEGILSSAQKDKNDSLTYVGLLITIGNVYVSMSQYDKALDNYNTALRITAHVKNDYLDIWALNGIGKVYMSEKDFGQAIRYYERSLQVSNGLNGHSFKAEILNEMGNVYVATGDLVKALQYAQQSLVILDGSSDMEQLPKTYTTLGKIYAGMNNCKEAVKYLLKAIDIYKKTGAIDNEKDAWQALSKSYEQMHETVKAFDAYRHFIVLRDSVYNTDKAKELVRIDLQAGFSRQQLADSLKQDAAKKVFAVKLQRQRIISIGGFAGLVLVLLLSFFIYRNYSQQKKANKIIRKANAAIRKEKQVSENLLLNILPEDVAQELKVAGKVHAKLYDQVSVLFTDFVDFTKAGERMSPQELVAELDTCFQAFDMIIGKYNAEKIKTVGDAYMAVSGLPQANANHACDIVNVALEILDFMVLRRGDLGDKTFGIRIGIHTGSVVAGIVGVKKFAYDIWGDTVNTAARMEQNSEAGKINISQTTYEQVKDKFACAYRGEINAKGKGQLKMYFAGRMSGEGDAS